MRMYSLAGFAIALHVACDPGWWYKLEGAERTDGGATVPMDLGITIGATASVFTQTLSITYNVRNGGRSDLQVDTEKVQLFDSLGRSWPLNPRSSDCEPSQGRIVMRPGVACTFEGRTTIDHPGRPLFGHYALERLILHPGIVGDDARVQGWTLTFTAQ